MLPWYRQSGLLSPAARHVDQALPLRRTTPMMPEWHGEVCVVDHFGRVPEGIRGMKQLIKTEIIIRSVVHVLSPQER